MDRSEVDQLVFLLAHDPPLPRAEIAVRLNRTVRRVHREINRLYALGVIGPSRDQLRATLTNEQHEIRALYRRKKMPARDAWEAVLASLTAQRRPIWLPPASIGG
jgi:DNA-binding MarR family transcriptional regulator